MLWYLLFVFAFLIFSELECTYELTSSTMHGRCYLFLTAKLENFWNDCWYVEQFLNSFCRMWWDWWTKYWTTGQLLGIAKISLHVIICCFWCPLYFYLNCLLSAVFGVDWWRSKVPILWRPWLHYLWCLRREDHNGNLIVWLRIISFFPGEQLHTISFHVNICHQIVQGCKYWIILLTVYAG